MNCTNHDQALAVATCASCGRSLCEACALRLKGKVSCKQCLEAADLQSSTTAKQRKSPGLAAVFSIIPGIGQVYIGYYTAGFINFLVVAGTIAVLSSTGDPEGLAPFLGCFLSFFWIFNMIDAWRKAKLYNQYMIGEFEEKLPTDSPLFGGVALLILGLLLTLEITFDVDVEIFENIWPIGVIAAGAFMIWRYVRARGEATGPAHRPSLRDASPGDVDSPTEEP
jgi:hypothetical protein